MNLKPLILLIALPSLADAQSNTFYIQQRAPIITQNTDNQGNIHPRHQPLYGPNLGQYNTGQRLHIRPRCKR